METYEEAVKVMEAKRARRYSNARAFYIMEKDGEYTVANGLEEKEYGESLGWKVVSK